jgi:hypothetical protein
LKQKRNLEERKAIKELPRKSRFKAKEAKTPQVGGD